MVGFEAIVTSATEGDSIGLTITNSAYLPIEWWTEDRSVVSGLAGDYAAASQQQTYVGQRQYGIATYDYPDRAEGTESFEIHVRIAGYPETEVVLEADIFDDDASFSPY